MRPGRLLLLLLTAIPGLQGMASRHPVQSPVSVSSISSPRERLPAPEHNEATCPFCQAALFAPVLLIAFGVRMALGIDTAVSEGEAVEAA